MLSPTKSDEMKNRLKTSTLIIGIIVAIIALSNSSVTARTSETNDIKELKPSEVEMMEIIAQVLDENVAVKKVVECIKIYNSKSQLVYESRDENDERLKILIRRSDLICCAGTSSYYLLDN